MAHTKKHWWISLSLVGLPDRRTATLVWWGLLVTTIAVPIYFGMSDLLRPETRRPAAMLVLIAGLGATVNHGICIRWMNTHDAWNDADEAAFNRCSNCNYDLRASENRCPECGWEVVKTTRPSQEQNA